MRIERVYLCRLLLLAQGFFIVDHLSSNPAHARMKRRTYTRYKAHIHIKRQHTQQDMKNQTMRICSKDTFSCGLLPYKIYCTIAIPISKCKSNTQTLLSPSRCLSCSVSLCASIHISFTFTIYIPSMYFDFPTSHR